MSELLHPDRRPYSITNNERALLSAMFDLGVEMVNEPSSAVFRLRSSLLYMVDGVWYTEPAAALVDVIAMGDTMAEVEAVETLRGVVVTGRLMRDHEELDRESRLMPWLMLVEDVLERADSDGSAYHFLRCLVKAWKD